MTNQQGAPEIYALHTVPNEGETPWGGIYAVRADAERDAKVMRDATGRDWSVVRLVVADIATTPTGPMTEHDWRHSTSYGGELCATCGAAKGTRRGRASCGTAQQPAPTPQADSQPARDERDDFEKTFPRPPGCIRCGTGYASTDYSNWAAHTHVERWKGWQARAARAQADSVLEDAARLDFLIEQRAYVVSDPDACPGYWLHFVHKETGKCWAQGDEHPTPRAAIDAARKQGANHD